MMNITEIVRYEPVARGINPGLSGKTLVDNLIGAVESALSADPRSSFLQECYASLHERYPTHFTLSPTEKERYAH